MDSPPLALRWSMVLVDLLSLRLATLVRFRVAPKTRTVAIRRNDPSRVSDLAAGSACGQHPGFLSHAARLAGILHVIVIRIRKRSDCVCTGQRWSNVAESRLATRISRCGTAGLD